mgnify:CR=1 FL=1
MMMVMLGRPIMHHSPARLGKKRAKVAKVMHEYGEGMLRSSSGQAVTSHDQAVAIAMSEAGLARKKKRGH